MKTRKELEDLYKHERKNNQSEEMVSFVIKPWQIVIIICCIVMGIIALGKHLNNKKDSIYLDSNYANGEIAIASSDLEEQKGEKWTEVDDKVYENGEMAEIATEKGNYNLGIKNVVLIPEEDGFEAVYKITWCYENIDFQNAYGLWITCDSFEITDSKDNTVQEMMVSWNDDDWSNYSTGIFPGEKREEHFTYSVADADCDYLNITMIDRDVHYKIKIDKANGKENNIEQKKIGDLVKIETGYGDIEFSLEKICKASATDKEQQYEEIGTTDKALVFLEGTVKNINYDLESTVGEVLIGENDLVIEGKNENGILSYVSFDDNEYECFPNVPIGEQKKICIPFYISENEEKVNILFNQKYEISDCEIE